MTSVLQRLHSYPGPDGHAVVFHSHLRFVGAGRRSLDEPVARPILGCRNVEAAQRPTCSGKYTFNNGSDKADGVCSRHRDHVGEYRYWRAVLV